MSLRGVLITCNFSEIFNKQLCQREDEIQSPYGVFDRGTCRYVVFWLHTASIPFSPKLKVHQKRFVRVKIWGKSGLVGLGVWFSLRVREVPGSNPGRALPVSLKEICHYVVSRLPVRSLKSSTMTWPQRSALPEWRWNTGPLWYPWKRYMSLHGVYMQHLSHFQQGY